MSKETVFVAEINERVVNFTNTVRAVLTSKQLTVADILNYYSSASRLRPDLRQSPQKLVQWNLEPNFPLDSIVINSPKQISQVESEGKKYLVFETEQARDDIIGLGLIEEDFLEDQIRSRIKEYLQPVISKINDWLEEVNLEDSLKALRESIGGKKLRRIISEFIGKESPDSTGLVRSPQRRQTRVYLSSLENLSKYPFGNLLSI